MHHLIHALPSVGGKMFELFNEIGAQINRRSWYYIMMLSMRHHDVNKHWVIRMTLIADLRVGDKRVTASSEHQLKLLDRLRQALRSTHYAD